MLFIDYSSVFNTIPNKFLVPSVTSLQASWHSSRIELATFHPPSPSILLPLRVVFSLFLYFLHMQDCTGKYTAPIAPLNHCWRLDEQQFSPEHQQYRRVALLTQGSRERGAKHNSVLSTEQWYMLHWQIATSPAGTPGSFTQWSKNHISVFTFTSVCENSPCPLMHHRTHSD